MPIRIEKQYATRIPFDAEKFVAKLLRKIPSEHIVGLESIMLVDEATHMRDKKSGGLYWQRMGHEPARIEIALDTIYKDMPRIIFYLPFIAKFMLANVLYHEIGHHIQCSTHGVTKRDGENFATRYKKEMLNKAFLSWRLLLLSVSPLIRWLSDRKRKKRK